MATTLPDRLTPRYTATALLKSASLVSHFRWIASWSTRVRRWEVFGSTTGISTPGMGLAQVRCELLLCDWNNSEIATAFMQSSVGGGERSTAATAYLHPVDSRKNLDILLNSQVTKILPTNNRGGQPSLRTVQFSQGPTSKSSDLWISRSLSLTALFRQTADRHCKQRSTLGCRCHWLAAASPSLWDRPQSRALFLGHQDSHQQLGRRPRFERPSSSPAVLPSQLDCNMGHCPP